MPGSNKLTRNKEAELHKLTEEDSIRLKDIWLQFVSEINYVVSRDELPEAVWYPSENFEFLIRQKD